MYRPSLPFPPSFPLYLLPFLPPSLIFTSFPSFLPSFLLYLILSLPSFFLSLLTSFRFFPPYFLTFLPSFPYLPFPPSLPYFLLPSLSLFLLPSLPHSLLPYFPPSSFPPHLLPSLTSLIPLYPHQISTSLHSSYFFLSSLIFDYIFSSFKITLPCFPFILILLLPLIPPLTHPHSRFFPSFQIYDR